MIDALKSLFFPAPPGRPVIRPEVAVAALLVDAARADGDYAESERRAVTALLAQLFSLSPTEALALRTEAEAAQAETPDLVRFTRVIKTALDLDQRIAVVEGLWRVVLADDRRDPHEDALLRHLAPLLGVDDRDSALARQRAAG